MFEIIVINYNNADGLKSTLNSIADQIDIDRVAKVHLIDGDSTDGSIVLAKNFEHIINMNVISEPDSGIYDAMNKGLLGICDKNSYIIYLNSGDTFYNKHSISEILLGLKESNSNIIFFKTENYFENIISHRPKSNEVRNFSHEIPGKFFPCHQAVLIKASVLCGYIFDSKMKISADTVLLNELFMNNSFVYIPKLVVRFELGGISNYYNNYKQFFTHYSERVYVMSLLDDANVSFLRKTTVFIKLFIKYALCRLLSKRQFFKIQKKWL